MKIYVFAMSMIFTMAAQALTTGQVAPDFTLPGTSSKSKDISLSDFKGKIVVLEWLNHGCPFVRKHYDSGNMTGLQKKYVAKNVIWLSIISSAPGKQGHVDTNGAIQEKKQYQSAATDILLDPTGKIGKLYDAKTTPHMYVINKEGVLVYQGAIDNKPDTEKASVASARNFVSEAIEETIKGNKVSAATTKAYGCSIKY